MTSTESIPAPAYRLRPEVKGPYLAALRGDEYLQGLSYLRYEQDGQAFHCCLGVLCELAVQAGVVQRSDATITNGVRIVYDYGVDPSHSMPPQEVLDWAFENPPQYSGFRWYVPVDQHPQTGRVFQEELTSLNDNRRWTFAQIADAIEAGL